jgi:beta-lactam-binding protein with PASTA domain
VIAGLLAAVVIAWVAKVGPFGDDGAAGQQVEAASVTDDSVTHLLGVNAVVKGGYQRGLAEPALATLPPAPRANGGTWTGDLPGLYGATRASTACDRSAATGLAGRDDAKAEAWQSALGSPAAAAELLGGLTPVVLLADTAVRHHRYRDQLAVSVPAVLQAGTEVWVDRNGVPRIRCADLGPLGPAPATLPAPTDGEAWDGLDVGAAGRVTPAATTLAVLELAATEPGAAQPFVLRPVGSDGGGADVGVPGRDPSGRRPVPDFGGVTGAAASDQARTYGWKVTVEARFDPAANETVIDQVPPPGSPLAAGETVTLIVSRGPKTTVPVPALPGLALEVATAELAKIGLVAEVVEQPTKDVPENTIVSSDPPAGTEVRQATKVKIVVARYPTARVPDVVGRSSAAAVAALNGAGFATNVSERFDDNVAAGAVIGTSPQPNEVVRVDTPVEVAVSRGRAILVPNLAGQNGDQALATLRSLGLTAIENRQIDAKVPAGVVIAHAPGPGTPLLAGEVVTVVVSDGPYTGPPIISVPNVAGLTAAQAEAQLRALGLNPFITQHPSATVPVGVVIATVPGPTTPLVQGSSVEVAVSRGPV